MEATRTVIALLVLIVSVVVASCASQPYSSTPFAMQKDIIEPATLTASPGQQGKKPTVVGSDSDCVLTTGDLHLWCNWITRYY